MTVVAWPERYDISRIALARILRAATARRRPFPKRNPKLLGERRAHRLEAVLDEDDVGAVEDEACAAVHHLLGLLDGSRRRGPVLAGVAGGVGDLVDRGLHRRVIELAGDAREHGEVRRA